MRLRLALAAECALLLAASAFGEFTQSAYAARCVALLFGAGVCFLLALRWRGPGAAPARSATLPHGLALPDEAAPPKPRRGVSAGTFWGAAIALRLAMLGCEPGDDTWRYIWEGRVQLHGFNPYQLRPDAPVLLPLRDPTWPKINHPEWPAIYPPAAELIFAGIAAISPTVLAFKLFFIAADLATLWILVQLCVGGRHDAAWYAWNPAVIYAFAGGAHYDSLLLLSMSAGLWVLVRAGRKPGFTWSESLASAGMLGMAISIKVVPIFLVPAWICALKKKSAALLLTAAIPLLLALPYGGPTTVLENLRSFADVARFNDLIWWLFEPLTVHIPYDRNWPFTLVLGLAVLGAVYRFRHDWARGMFWSMGLTLALSPILHPWYVTWILPLACWRQVPAWSILSISVLGALLLWETTRFWTMQEPNLFTHSIVLLPALIAWGRTHRLTAIP